MMQKRDDSMDVHFDYYLIHPRIAVMDQRRQIVQAIIDFMRMDRTAALVMEAQENLLGNRVLDTAYAEVVQQFIDSSGEFPERMFLLSGQTCYSCAKRLITNGAGICFVCFPYQDMRTLHGDIQGTASNTRYALLDFSDGSSAALDPRRDTRVFSPLLPKELPQYTAVQDPEASAVRDMLPGIELLETTTSSNVYRYRDADRNLIFKSPRRVPKDYFLKIDDLIRLREHFVKNSVNEAFPQNVIRKDGISYGVVSNYIAGDSIEKLYYDIGYREFMAKHHYEANIVNRVYILIKLISTVFQYHSLGIYLSDIKGDNFIVTPECDVIPIDSDGFSYYRYYSSCPRPEMMRDPEKDHTRNLLQKTEFENYSFMVMTYKFLMAGNNPHPLPGKKSSKAITIDMLYRDDAALQEGERGRVLAARWKQYPLYLRRTLYESISGGQPHSVQTLLWQLIRFYGELTEKKAEPLFRFVSAKPEFVKVSPGLSARHFELFDTICVEKAHIPAMTVKKPPEAAPVEKLPDSIHAAAVQIYPAPQVPATPVPAPPVRPAVQTIPVHQAPAGELATKRNESEIGKRNERTNDWNKFGKYVAIAAAALFALSSLLVLFAH